jgi:DNA-binding PadR family transcriptional regulator
MSGADIAASTGRCHHHRHHHAPRDAQQAWWAGFTAMISPSGGGPGGRPEFGGRESFEWGRMRGGGPRGGRGGRRARRGDIRSAALLLLSEGPRNGYGLMQELEERSGGVWRPSPGSVYPALAQLEDEGLIAPTQADGRKAFELTDEGRAHVEEHRERLGTPWADMAEGANDELSGLREAGKGLWMATMQLSQTGSKAQLAEAKTVLDDARRALYRLLAGDEPR